MGKKLRGSILPASSEGEVAVGFSRQSAIEVFLVRQRAIARGAIQDMASGGSGECPQYAYKKLPSNER